MTTTQRHFHRQFDALADQLAPYVIEIDGQQFLGMDAPAPLADLYSKMMSIGIYNGWL